MHHPSPPYHLLITNCLDSTGGEAIESLSILDPFLIDGPGQGVRGTNTFEVKFKAITSLQDQPSCLGLYARKDG
jgi:hypothetical protein